MLILKMLSINNYLSEEEKEKIQHINDKYSFLGTLLDTINVFKIFSEVPTVEQIKRNKIAEIMFTSDNSLSLTKYDKILNTDVLQIINEYYVKDIDYLYIIYKSTNINNKRERININDIRLLIKNGEISKIYKGPYNNDLEESLMKVNKNKFYSLFLEFYRNSNNNKIYRNYINEINENIKKNCELIYDDNTLKFKYTNILDIKEHQPFFEVTIRIPYQKLKDKKLKGYYQHSSYHHYVYSIEDVDTLIYNYQDIIDDVQTVCIKTDNRSSLRMYPTITLTCLDFSGWHEHYQIGVSECSLCWFHGYPDNIDKKIVFNNMFTDLYKPEMKFIHSLQFKETTFSFEAISFVPYDGISYTLYNR